MVITWRQSESETESESVLLVFPCVDPPPSVLKPRDVSVIPGDDALFTCIAFSTVDFNLTWLRYNSSLSEYLQLADNAEVFANGSLSIRFKQRLIHSVIFLYG